MDRSRSNNSNGQLMIEAMVAISLMMIGMLGAFGVLSQSLGLNRIAVDQYIAANLASEGIEIVRNFIDYDYLQGNLFGESVLEARDKKCVVDYKTEPGDWSGKCSGESKNLPNIAFNEESQKYGYGTGFSKQTSLRRYVDIGFDTENGADIIEVISTVEWVGRGGIDFNISVEDKFYNWRR